MAARPAAVAASTAATWDGIAAGDLAARLRLPDLHVRDVIGSTMDLAHALAADGAPAGTAVLADAQSAGRGRQGRAWTSPPGQGIWVTLVERPSDPAAVEVLSLRVGLALAEALEPLSDAPIRLKWPNDVFAGTGKLAGILCEARWRDARPDWLAIGLGVNVGLPHHPGAGALRPGTSRLDALARIIPAVRAAAAASGPLDASELARFAARDLAAGRRVVAPAPGVVTGIDGTGAVIISGPDGPAAFRAGSLVFAEDA